jgi:hypothetical protein
VGVNEPELWLRRAVGRAYAKCGEPQRAFAIARELYVRPELQALACADIASRTSVEQNENEWRTRRSEDTWKWDAASEAALWTRMPKPKLSAWRDEFLDGIEARSGTPEWRSGRLADFAVFLEDGRSEAISNYLDSLESFIARDEAREERISLLDDDCARLARLSSVMTAAELDRTLQLIRRSRAGWNDDRCLMFLVIASRRPQKLLSEALSAVGYLDKPYRVRVLAAAADVTTGTTRARIVAEAVGYARRTDYQPVSDLTVAAHVCEAAQRTELLQEALEKTAGQRDYSCSNARVVAATACLLPRTVRRRLIRAGLVTAERLDRLRFLEWFSSLHLLVASSCSTEELQGIERAVRGAAARWP